MTLKIKMLIYILVISSIIYILAVGYITYKLKTNALNDAKDKIDAIARENANSVKADLDIDMIMSRALAQALETYQDEPFDEWKDQQNEILKNIIRKNPEFVSVWSNWELSSIRPDYNKPDGRMRLTYYRQNNTINYKEEVLDTAEGFERGAYYDIKDSKEELVMDPYYFSYSGIEAEEILETSVGVPILDNNGEFLGLAGVDLSLERFQPLVKEIKPYENSYAFLVANNGTYVAHPEEKLVGEQMETNNKTENLLEKIKEGKPFSYTKPKTSEESEAYVSYAPIFIGEATTPWSFGLAVPIEAVMEQANQAFRRAIWVGVIGLLLVAMVIWIIAHNISQPIKKTTNVLSNLALGVIDKNNKLRIRTKDEIGQMSESVNTLIEGLNKTVNFAREIGKGNLEENFELLSEKDELGNSLLEMQESLKEAQQKEEERKREEEKQNWATKGLAKFGDILRQSSDDMKEFSYNIISNLVKYIDANQGALFIINDDDKNDIHLEMQAAYAYDRRKHIEKRIEMGEGLVGRAVQEQQTVYMTEIPDEYIYITSGLGHANPNCLLIVPLKVNDEVYGAIELAGFNQFEKHVRKFVEDVAEDIASTIKTTKINIRTNQLLEQSQQQSEELSSQEEEMRQNMEELKATQEEAARRNAEMEGLVKALKTSNYVIEYDMHGKILDVNENYLKLFNVKKKDIVGLHHTDYKEQQDTKEQDKYKKFWEDLRQGKTKKETSTIKIGKKKYTFIETYTPIMDQHGNPEKVLKIATDITDVVKK